MTIDLATVNHKPGLELIQCETFLKGKLLCWYFYLTNQVRIKMAQSSGGSAEIFEFIAHPIRLDDTQAEDFDFYVVIQLKGLRAADFLRLCEEKNLRIGLRLYESHSNSPIISEFRALDVKAGIDNSEIRGRMKIPRRYFEAQQCRIGQIDLLYENQFWFAEKVGSPPFLPIWVEKPPREVDVFEYYFSKMSA